MICMSMLYFVHLGKSELNMVSVAFSGISGILPSIKGIYLGYQGFEYIKGDTCHTHRYMHIESSCNSVLHCHLQRNTAISCTIRLAQYVCLSAYILYIFVSLSICACTHSSMRAFCIRLSLIDNSVYGAAHEIHSLMTRRL